MAANSDGPDLTAVVTCEGDLGDPEFAVRFDEVVGRLNGLLGEAVKVHKLEPWNSVRVTLSIPREAALRLRKLASEGSQQLRALGILSVQVEGDQVISLRIATGSSVNSEPQEIILQTTQDGASTSGRQDAEGALSRFLTGGSLQAVAASGVAPCGSSGGGVAEPPEKVAFKSPNVVCPADSVVPKVPVTVAANNVTTPPIVNKSYSAPFPFTSMNQAIHSSVYPAPPPPYPGNKAAATTSATVAPPPANPPAVAISSPLLVNLLQNDGGGGGSAPPPQKLSEQPQTSAAVIAKQPPPPPPVLQQQPQRTLPANRAVVNNNVVTKGPIARLLGNSVNNVNSVVATEVGENKRASPHLQQVTSALTTSNSTITNTSIGQKQPNSTILNNYPATIASRLPQQQQQPLQNLHQQQQNQGRQLPPPPPYPVAVNNRTWDAALQSAPFMDLMTPSLTDLKADDLDDLLPSLERDLARSPPDFPDELTTTRVRCSDDKRNFLINPLTGELEPQSSCESDDDLPGDVFTGLPSPAAISDDDTSSTTRPDLTDQSDSETRSSSHSDSGKHRVKTSTKVKDRGRDSPGLKPTEKIKLRLKLEKSEPIKPAYKVDVSFIQQPNKVTASIAAPPICGGATTTPPPGEELRVPPLHISLRGRHHAFITNKKKSKSSADGTTKAQKKKIDGAGAMASGGKTKKLGDSSAIMVQNSDDSQSAVDVAEKSVKFNSEPKKAKKMKVNHEHGKDANSALSLQDVKMSSHHKDKQKERRGSDSDLARANLKFIIDSNGVVSGERKRRLSQSEIGDHHHERPPPILGSTNVGTIAGLPQKSRKDKTKAKDGFKVGKDLTRKNFAKLTDKYLKKVAVALPTGEIDMEAKFKQRLMEGSEKGVPRPPHRTDHMVHQVMVENNQLEKVDKVVKTESEPPPSNVVGKEKSPEPDKCSTPDRTKGAVVVGGGGDLGDKQAGRSPNSGAQGEDSGIESMDALSEKSPNQASQSPHADIIADAAPPPLPKSAKTQVPDMLDIEAQLAKMEGLNGVEDVNENNQHSNGGSGSSAAQAKLGQCCELTSALQDSLKQGAVTLSVSANALPVKEQQADVSLVPLKSSKTKDDLEPLPVRVTPPLYTYSNPEKGRGPDSPPDQSDDDSNPLAGNGGTSTSNNMIVVTPNKNKSLLEQLLIEIPQSGGDGGGQTPSSPSPATRSVRTRALSKRNSPELNSPITTTTTTTNSNAAVSGVNATPIGGGANNAKQTRSATPATSKRKRHESEGPNNGLDQDGRNKKPRKCSENAAELIKVCMGVDLPAKVNNVKRVAPSHVVVGGGAKVNEESSDSDEPLIEKVRKTTSSTANNSGVVTKGKVAKIGVKNSTVSTRRSVRTTVPAPNTRSKGDKVIPDADALRRKTRSAVSEGESNKRKKEVK